MKILMIGDIVGRPGRRAIKELVPSLRETYAIDLVIANGENAAGGRGLTPDTADEIMSAGVDVITSGNHIWQQKEIIPYFDTEVPVLRPLNYPPGVPGRGYLFAKGVLVVNLMGRTFMPSLDCPFRAINKLLEELPQVPPIIFVDFHAEATSEKVAMGWYLDGRASAVIGTHTHVGTADARLLPKGTAYLTDVGMTGPRNSVIGNDVEAVITRFLTQTPIALPVATGPVLFNSALVEIEDATGRAKSISRLDLHLE